jgi:DNA polymerase III sliding clamp (beta) subunit (PCNA family)
MIVISRAMARQFRTVAKKCKRRALESDSDLVIKQGKGKLTFTTKYSEAAIQVEFTALSDNEAELVMPMNVLDRILQLKTDHIELHCPKNMKGQARWVESGIPCSFSVLFQAPNEQHSPLERPTETTPVPARFLKGLNECGRSAAKQDSRFALTRIQVRGKQGQIIGTDSYTGLFCHGFALPFAEDILLPAIPVFGMSDLQSQEVTVGKTARHFVVSAGPWTIWLSIITEGKYPDLNSLIPRQSETLAKIDAQDASALLNVLEHLPGMNEDDRPVTLDFDERIKVRACDSESGETKEIILAQSPVEGPPVCVAVNRDHLARALTLGCHSLRGPASPDKPLISDGEGMTFIASTLKPELIVPPSNEATATSKVPVPQSTLPQRRTEMRQTDQNGRNSNGRTESPPTVDTADPLIIVEELRSALADATTKANKLATILKSGRKEKKVLANVFAGLKQLNLNGSNP